MKKLYKSFKDIILENNLLSLDGSIKFLYTPEEASNLKKEIKYVNNLIDNNKNDEEKKKILTTLKLQLMKFHDLVVSNFFGYLIKVFNKKKLEITNKLMLYDDHFELTMIQNTNLNLKKIMVINFIIWYIKNAKKHLLCLHQNQLAKYFNCSREWINKIISFACKVNLFTKKIKQDNKLLTYQLPNFSNLEYFNANEFKKHIHSLKIKYKFYLFIFALIVIRKLITKQIIKPTFFDNVQKILDDTKINSGNYFNFLNED